MTIKIHTKMYYIQVKHPANKYHPYILMDGVIKPTHPADTRQRDNL